MAAETRSKKKLKTTTAAEQQRQPDRLSALPDDILRKILAATAAPDLRTAAARASLLSRRWCDLWRSTLRELRFAAPPRRLAVSLKNRLRFAEYVDRVLAGCRDSAIDLISLTANDGDLDAETFGPIYEYGSAHRVPEFRLAVRGRTTRAVVGSFPSGFASFCHSLEKFDLSLLGFCLEDLRIRSGNFPCLESLRLYRCELFVPDSLPPADDYEPFKGMLNLKKVELIDCVIETKNAVKVLGDKLEEIEIVFQSEPHLFETKICAPNATKLTCVGVRLARFTSVELPSLEMLDVDFWSRRSMSKVLARRLDEALVEAWEEERADREMFIRTFHKFESAKCVKMSSSAAEGLTLVYFAVQQGRIPPFRRVKHVELRSPRPCYGMVFATILVYLFNQNMVAPAELVRLIDISAPERDDDNPRTIIRLRDNGCRVCS